MTLVILAAGMGSRFGGLKQVEPVGPNNEFIIDYSIYDAIKAGFNKIVFIIKEENFELFKETVGNRIEGKVEVEYVFQKQDNVPDFVKIPSDRVKPWGTAHAIYSCKDVVKDKFAIINADDFYGFDAFKSVYNALLNDDEDFQMVGYKVINTLTENGSVKRGYCEIEDGCLTNLIESSIEEIDGNIVATPLDGREKFVMSDNDIVSMNLFGFNTKIFDFLEKRFNEFFKENENSLDKCEWLIPDEVFKMINNKEIKVKVLSTESRWFGVTYKEDKESLVNAIEHMIISGMYKSNLWD